MDIEEIASEIVIDKPKKKRGRPKKVKPPVVIDDNMSDDTLPDEMDELNIASILERRFDVKSALKNMYLSNRVVLKHLNISKINKMNDDTAYEELEMCQMLINEKVSASLTGQILSAFNGLVSYLFGLDTSSFDDDVQGDENIVAKTKNLTNKYLLNYINDDIQFALLYSSKVGSAYKNKRLIKEKRVDDEINAKAAEIYASCSKKEE